MELIVCPLCDEQFRGFSVFAQHLLHHGEAEIEGRETTIRSFHRQAAWWSVLHPFVQGDLMEIMNNEDLIEGLLCLADHSSFEHPWELKYEIKTGEVYVECGAYHARYTRKIISRLGANVDIILIEPSPINAAVIRAYIKRTELKNIVLIEKAIGKEQKLSSFVVGSEGFSGEHLGSSGNNTITVEVDTLDNMMADLGIDRIDLLAADIEGAEANLVEGAGHLLSEKKIRNVAIAAYHGPAMAPLVQKGLQKHGYTDLVYEGGTVYGHI